MDMQFYRNHSDRKWLLKPKKNFSDSLSQENCSFDAFGEVENKALVLKIQVPQIWKKTYLYT